MKKIKNQKGIGVLGLFFAIFIGISTLTLIVKIVPSYIENFTLKSVLQGIEQDFKGKKSTPATLRDIVQKRLKINNIRSVKDLDVRIIKNPDNLELKVEYEVEKDIVGNIAILMRFKETAKVTN